LEACGSIKNLFRSHHPYMRKLVTTIALSFLVLPAFSQTQTCLRVMPIDEIVHNSILIGRVRVQKTEKARYRGEFGQLATLIPVDVIDGDFTLKELNVLARSNVRCAEDSYVRDEEVLVFLEPQDSLFHTVNYQYGLFRIVGDLVRGWRDKGNKPCDKPYPEVRAEILNYVNAARKPPAQKQPGAPQPQPPAQPQKPPSVSND
jgi:hypothetical protein